MKSSWSNHRKAWEFFYPEGKGESKRGYVLHHVDETLRDKDPDRYNEWRIEDLVMMTKGEHVSLHHTGKNPSEETRKRISEHHADVSGKRNPMYHHVYTDETRAKMSMHSKGRRHTEDSKKKMSESKKGELSYWWTNGTVCVRGLNPPDGFVRGRNMKPKDMKEVDCLDLNGDLLETQ